MKKWFNDIQDRLFKKKKNTAQETREIAVTQESWWGNIVVEPEQSRYIKMSHLLLFIDHFNQEWHITCTEDLPQKVVKNKVIIKNPGNEFYLAPALYDRSLICALKEPLLMPSGMQITFYCVSPVSIRLSLKNDSAVLATIPTQILSDTWYGKNSMEGELCYAGPTPMLELEEPVDTLHCITPIQVMNVTRDTYLLKELKIPHPYLSIYEDASHSLWTEQLQITFSDSIMTSTILKTSRKPLKELTLVSRGLHGQNKKFTWFKV